MFVKSLFLLAAFSLAKKPCKENGIPYPPEGTNYDHNKKYHKQSAYTTAELNQMAQSMIDTARKDARSLIQTAKAAGKQLVKQANEDAARLKSMANNLDFANEMNQDAQKLYDQAIQAANQKAENQRQRIQALAHQKQLDEQQAMIQLQQRQHAMSQINKNLHENPEWFSRQKQATVPNYRGEVMVRDEGSAVVLRGFDPMDAPSELRRKLFDPWVIIIIIIFLTVENLVLNALGTDENLVSYVMGLINGGCKDGEERARATKTCWVKCTAGSSRQDDGSCAVDPTDAPGVARRRRLR